MVLSRHALDLGEVADAHGAECARLAGGGVEGQEQVVVGVGEVGEDAPFATQDDLLARVQVRARVSNAG